VTLATEEIQLVCDLVDELAGIQWSAEKSYLVESRLLRVLRDHDCADFTDMVTRVRKGDTTLRGAVVDAVTTRETLFFRDDSPFAALRNKALPEIIDGNARTVYPKRLRFWSAACSSGQEPYSLAITLREILDDVDTWDISILATDLSDAALESASNGIYSDFEMSRGVTPEIRKKYFHQVDGGWQINQNIREMVTFQQRNLLEPFTDIGPFEVIFCRNVAIYFDLPVKVDLFHRLAKVLTTTGAMFVGSSETLSFMGERWKALHHCRGVFYQPNRKDIMTASVAEESPKKPTAKPVARTSTAAPTSGPPLGSVVRMAKPTPLATTKPAVSIITKPSPTKPGVSATSAAKLTATAATKPKSTPTLSPTPTLAKPATTMRPAATVPMKPVSTKSTAAPKPVTSLVTAGARTTAKPTPGKPALASLKTGCLATKPPLKPAAVPSVATKPAVLKPALTDSRASFTTTSLPPRSAITGNATGTPSKPTTIELVRAKSPSPPPIQLPAKLPVKPVQPR
jgi:chemotaxis protein methyltransferase CheR